MCTGVCLYGPQQVVECNYGDSTNRCMTGRKASCCEESVFGSWEAGQGMVGVCTVLQLFLVAFRRRF